jgi:hypothetical protein
MEEIIVIISGSRGFTNYRFIEQKLDKILSLIPKNIKIKIITGECKNSPDMCGKRYAQEKGYEYEGYPADWEKYGKVAGHIRNVEMGQIGTHLVAFWNGKSPGTEDMIKIAGKYGLKKRVIIF